MIWWFAFVQTEARRHPDIHCYRTGGGKPGAGHPVDRVPDDCMGADGEPDTFELRRRFTPV